MAISTALVQTMAMVLSDEIPKQGADVALFFGQTDDMSEGLFERAAELFHAGAVRYIAITGSKGERFGGTIPGECWAGGAVWRERLVARGIPDEKILTSRPSFHTRDDADGLCELAYEHQFTSGIIIAAPFHATRCMLSLIAAMHAQNYLMRVYVTTARGVDWFEPKLGPQSLESKSTAEHLLGEIERIETYQATGDVA
ncbi:MAG: hypothetical protein A2848_02665, partial [Candidatus Magasanikbacteria bacterium RIFCSPHIGHO2_01_FULL_50_8]